MPANVSAKLPTVATDWHDRVTLRDARRRRRSAIRHLRDKATTKTAVLEREVFRRRMRRMRYASLKAGTTASASSANKVLVNQRMKRARWSVAGSRNVLAFRAGEVGPLRRRVAGDDRAARTKALNAVAA